MGLRPRVLPMSRERVRGPFIADQVPSTAPRRWRVMTADKSELIADFMFEVEARWTVKCLNFLDEWQDRDFAAYESMEKRGIPIEEPPAGEPS